MVQVVIKNMVIKPSKVNSNSKDSNLWIYPGEFVVQ